MKIKSLTKNLSLCYHSHKVTEIFFIIDEFDKNFEKIVSDHSLVQNTDLKQRNCKSTLSDSEVITILILFHSVHFSIKGSDGSVIEMGEAKLKDSDWLYTATVSNSTLSDTKIEVLAYDVPEHKTQKHIIL